MEILTGTKREITLKQWTEQLQKHIKRANDSATCFYNFSEASDLDHLIEDCQKIIEIAQGTKQVIDFMDRHGIN